ncbi:DUF3396 domain-containing protein [Actinoplanes bogorensis]|uniref:DUF3396 domain-containing protein n=1 Tax=Paractinoplanes bogorensis TaxID=1610840 RepID=A0ABS5YUT3_9ACTN|nr:DUF3396 domain-containing protein [Actinoplanes bogorensis]MBU2667096.1 DUF3396 domain-containing protein [Actinoplanes bogorensis]
MLDFATSQASMDFALDVQLNVDSSAGDAGQVVYDWLEQGFAALAGDVQASIADLPADTAAAGKAAGTGDSFGQITVSRRRGDGPRLVRTERTASREGWQWLRAEVAELPVGLKLVTGRLDETGIMVGSSFNGYVAAYPESPGWLQLRATVNRSKFVAVQRSWVDFVFSFADRVNPGYGQVTYSYDQGSSVVEETTQPRTPERWRRDPAVTIGRCRETLRGYGWLTVLAQELADRVGGANALRGTGAFAQVRQLQRGGVGLLVTDDLEDYTERTAEPAFRVLAPLLPPGEPFTVGRSPMRPPVIVVPVDPASMSGAG